MSASQQIRNSNDSSSSIHSTMLNALRAHDSDAWRRMLHIFSPQIYDWCRQQGLQAADAADLMQEVFRSVMRGIADFRRQQESESFRGWLWTITRNKIIDSRRRGKGQPASLGGSDAWQRMTQVPQQEPDNQDSVSGSQISSSPLHRAMAVIRNDFSANTWHAFWRTTVDAQKAADVAMELGISVNAVRKAKSRVLRRLRTEFGDLLE